ARHAHVRAGLAGGAGRAGVGRPARPPDRARSGARGGLGRPRARRGHLPRRPQGGASLPRVAGGEAGEEMIARRAAAARAAHFFFDMDGMGFRWYAAGTSKQPAGPEPRVTDSTRGMPPANFFISSSAFARWSGGILSSSACIWARAATTCAVT